MNKRSIDWWDRWFLGLAAYAATASKDPSTRVGAALVGPDRRKIALGYNGLPRGLADSPERLVDRATKYRLTQHAEQNCLDNATFDVSGATLYCTVHPCVRCAVSVISRRVARVVVAGPVPEAEVGRWTEEIPDAQAILREASVAVDVLCAPGADESEPFADPARSPTIVEQYGSGGTLDKFFDYLKRKR